MEDNLLADNLLSDEENPISSDLITLEKDQVLCVEGEENYDLYLIKSGKLMVCMNKGSQVTAVAVLGPEEFLGELSFFDRRPRSANVIALESSTLIKIPVEEIDHHFPQWLLTVACFMTKRTRQLDDFIRAQGIKKHRSTQMDIMRPLSLQEQGAYFKILKAYRKSQGLAEPSN